jgi:hypothetical protein
MFGLQTVPPEFFSGAEDVGAKRLCELVVSREAFAEAPGNGDAFFQVRVKLKWDTRLPAASRP